MKTGDFVTKGTELGVITDYFGKELQTVVAPASGVLLILFATPPVNVDDNIAVIGGAASISILDRCSKGEHNWWSLSTSVSLYDRCFRSYSASAPFQNRLS